jgi:hypothetical protein
MSRTTAQLHCRKYNNPCAIAATANATAAAPVRLPTDPWKDRRGPENAPKQRTTDDILQESLNVSPASLADRAAWCRHNVIDNQFTEIAKRG